MPNQVSRTLKLINEIGIYCCRSDLRSTPEYLWAWLGSWLVAMVDAIPTVEENRPWWRRTISPLVTALIIVVIVAVGAIVIYLLVVTPTTSTTITYP